MKLFIIASVLITNAAFAHEVSFPLLTDLHQKKVKQKCAELEKTINERLEILLPTTTSRMKVIENKVYLTESDYTEFSCVALINNIPGEATITYNLFSKSIYADDSCAPQVELAKSQNPKYLAVVDTISRPLIGKTKCLVNVLNIIPTVLN